MAQSGASNALEDSLLTEVDFAAVQGRRYDASFAFLSDRQNRAALIILALSIEPVRSLTSWLMRRAREGEDPCRQPCAQDTWRIVWARNERAVLHHSREFVDFAMA